MAKSTTELMTLSWKETLFHAVCFYIVWFSTVWLAGRDGFSAFFCIPVSIFLLQCFYEGRQRRLSSLFIPMGFFIFTGCVTDFLSIQFGIIHFASNPWQMTFPPPWLIFLWFEFSLTTLLLFHQYFHRVITISILGGLGFALAFYIGFSLDAVFFNLGMTSLWVLGLIWAVVFPCQIACISAFWRKS